MDLASRSVSGTSEAIMLVVCDVEGAWCVFTHGPSPWIELDFFVA